MNKIAGWLDTVEQNTPPFTLFLETVTAVQVSDSRHFFRHSPEGQKNKHYLQYSARLRFTLFVARLCNALMTFCSRLVSPSRSFCRWENSKVHSFSVSNNAAIYSAHVRHKSWMETYMKRCIWIPRLDDRIFSDMLVLYKYFSPFYSSIYTCNNIFIILLAIIS